MNICYCGSQAGYPHALDCPYPLFRGSERDVEEWERERERIQLGSPSTLEEFERLNESQAGGAR